MRKEERELRRLAEKFGLKLVHTKKHYRFIDATGLTIAYQSSTSSNVRAFRNLEAQIKRSLAGGGLRALSGSERAV